MTLCKFLTDILPQWGLLTHILRYFKHTIKRQSDFIQDAFIIRHNTNFGIRILTIFNQLRIHVHQGVNNRNYTNQK